MEASAVDVINDGKELHDALQFLFETHLELTKQKIREIIMSYERQRGNEGLKLAVSLVTKANNCGYNYAAFIADLEQYFPESVRQMNRGAEITYQHFVLFAQHASGNILDTDPLFIQARQLSSLSKEQLKEQIGIYFERETIKFISEEYHQQDSELSAAAAANDNGSPSLSPRLARRMDVDKDEINKSNEGRS